MFVKRSLLIAPIVQLLLVALAFEANAAKVSTSPSPLTILSQGESREIIFRLDQPMICSDTSTPCKLTLELANSAPGAVSLDTTTITWEASEWSQVRSLNITVAQRLTDSDSTTVQISSVAQSNSVYYSGFRWSMSQPIASPRYFAEINARMRQSRDAEIAAARRALLAKLNQGEAISLKEFHSADFFKVATGNISRVNELLLASAKKVPLTIAAISTLIDREWSRDELVTRIAVPGGIGQVSLKQLVEAELVEVQYKSKNTLLMAVRLLDSTSIRAFADLEKAIEAEKVRILKRSDRLKELLSKKR